MKWLNLLNANVRKEYIELKRYLPNTVSLFLTFYFIFLAMFLGLKFIGDPIEFDNNIQYGIVSYVFWFLSIICMQFIGFTITSEAMRGTLEQLYMSPMGVWRVMISRMIGSVLVNFVVIIFFLFAAMATAGQWLKLNPLTTVPILLFTMVSMFGVGFMIAGLSVIFKQIGAFLQILQFIFMGLTFVPLSVAPFLAFAPFVKGIDMIRTVIMQDLTITQLPGTDFLILAFNAVFYFIIGVFVFNRCEKIAMQKGLLGHY